MGDVALSAFLQVLFQAVVDLLKKEQQRLGNNFEAKRKRLASNVPMIQDVLNGAGKTPLSDQQKNWLADLKDVGYKMADVLDECYYEERRREVIPHLRSLRNNKVISSVNPSRRDFWVHIKNDIEEIEMSIENLVKLRSIFQIDSNGGCEGSGYYPSSSFPPVFVHGRQDDQDSIVKMLLQSDLKRNVEVLPILGEAYIGKTTVTQLVMNDERVSRHFDRRLWVHVSRDFNIERITASILEALGGGGPFHYNNFNTLQTNLKGQLQGRRFLLVLDDCWEENWHNWEKLQHPLLNGAVGSKIIVTTRSSAVVTGLRTSAFYQLRSLPDQACWLLFCQYAIGTDISDIQACNSEYSLGCRYFLFSPFTTFLYGIITSIRIKT